jgi:hypothetical protein
MLFAYADPPYIGQARKHYRKEATYGGEVDHEALIYHLVRNYVSGWALSCSSPSLKQILSYCPEGVRVMAWVKPFVSFKPGVNPAYAWEPVIVFGGRPRTRKQPTERDWVMANITMRKGLAGAKPKQFISWLFAVLNVQPGDELHDLFPGTGIVTSEFNKFQQQRHLWPSRREPSPKIKLR